MVRLFLGFKIIGFVLGIYDKRRLIRCSSSSREKRVKQIQCTKFGKKKKFIRNSKVRSYFKIKSEVFILVG